jgi:hypothetical protein
MQNAAAHRSPSPAEEIDEAAANAVKIAWSFNSWDEAWEDRLLIPDGCDDCTIFAAPHRTFVLNRPVARLRWLV